MVLVCGFLVLLTAGHLSWGILWCFGNLCLSGVDLDLCCVVVLCGKTVYSACNKSDCINALYDWVYVL